MAVAAEKKKILVRAPNWIGDAVMCLPAVEALKALYPESSITVLTRPPALPVFMHNPDVDSLMEYRSGDSHGGVKGKIALAGEIRRMGFDMAVLFQNAFDAAFVSFMAGIPERVGYARDLRTRLLTRPIKVTSENAGGHQIFYYLNIVREIGGSVAEGPAPPAPRIYTSPEERAWAGKFLADNGLGDSLLVGAAPGASYGPAKRWSPESFASVLNMLVGDFGAVPVIFGGRDDVEPCTDVARALDARHLNLAGSVSLRQFIALLSEMALFVTNDSGPMHLAAASGVPTVAVFGSTAPEATGPVGPSAVVVRNPIECSPCFERECRYGHYRCLASVPVEDVYSAGAGFLGRRAGAGGGP